MAAREKYIRAYAAVGEREGTVGLEMRPDDSGHVNAGKLLKVMSGLLERTAFQEEWWEEVTQDMEWFIKHNWPDRAYFIEVEEEGKGVQIFQPFGLPRGTA